jgi:hypothetical protein
MIESKNNKKFWEELIAYFPLIRHGLHRKRQNEGGIHRQQGDLISLPLFLVYFPYFEKIKGGL